MINEILETFELMKNINNSINPPALSSNDLKEFSDAIKDFIDAKKNVLTLNMNLEALKDKDEKAISDLLVHLHLEYSTLEWFCNELDALISKLENKIKKES